MEQIPTVFKPQISESVLILPASLCPKPICLKVLFTVLLKYFPLFTSLNLHLFVWAIISFTFCMDYCNSLSLSIFLHLDTMCTPYHGLQDHTDLSAAYLFYLISCYYLSLLIVSQSHLSWVCSYQHLKHTKLILSQGTTDLLFSDGTLFPWFFAWLDPPPLSSLSSTIHVDKEACLDHPI